MQPYDAKLMMETLGTTLPFAILLIENDEDRQFLTEMYFRTAKVPLMLTV